MFMKSTNLFRYPSLLKGIARTFDIFGKLDQYRYSKDPDSELIGQDWKNSGDDLKRALQKYEQKSYL